MASINDHLSEDNCPARKHNTGLLEGIDLTWSGYLLFTCSVCMFFLLFFCLFVCLYSLHLDRFGQLLRCADKRIVNIIMKECI